LHRAPNLNHQIQENSLNIFKDFLRGHHIDPSAGSKE
jgi:hypothetical protein